MNSPALAPVAPELSSEQQQYLRDLKRFDWRFRYSRGGGAYVMRCRRELERLRQLQLALDPKGVIWNGAVPPAWVLP
jgi:hypothetical protein